MTKWQQKDTIIKITITIIKVIENVVTDSRGKKMRIIFRFYRNINDKQPRWKAYYTCSLRRIFFRPLCQQFRHTPNSHTCQLLMSCFYSSKKSARNNLTLTCLLHLTSNTDFSSKTNRYCVYICTDCKRILAVIAKSIRHRSFSGTQTGRCSHAHLVIAYGNPQQESQLRGSERGQYQQCWEIFKLIKYFGSKVKL